MDRIVAQGSGPAYRDIPRHLPGLHRCARAAAALTIGRNANHLEVTMSSAPTRVPATACLALASALTLAACSTTAGTSSAAQPTTPAAATANVSPSANASASAAGDSIEDRAEVVIEDVAGEPDWPLEGFGSVWFLAADSEEPSLLRLDPATNEIVASVPIPGRGCQGFTVSDDAVWACVDEGVVRIDPATNAIVGEVSFESGSVASRLAFGDGSVWAIGADGGAPNELVRIDPVAMTAEVIPLGHGAATLAYGFDAVWLTAPQDGMVLRVDPGTEEVTEHATGLSRPQTVAIGPDSLWVTLFGAEEVAPDEPTVVRIDPTDGSVLAEIATGAASENLGGLWATDDAVWVRAPGAFLTRVDPTTNEVVETISGPNSTGDVTVAFGSLWATASSANVIYRMAP
jgi:sugar lactone lactonase YvrE